MASESPEIWPWHQDETAAAIRRLDLGSVLNGVDRWPAELRSAIAMILPSGSPIAVLWGADHLLFYNDRFARLALLKGRPESLGRPLAKVRPAWLRELEPEVIEARAGATSVLEGIGPEGQLQVFDLCCSPIREEPRGTVAGVLVTVMNARHHSHSAAAAPSEDANLNRLYQELGREMRNSFAIVRSIAERSARFVETVAEYQMQLLARIEAVSRVRGMPMRRSEDGIDLELLIGEEIADANLDEGDRIEIGGPKVRLSRHVAASLGLAVYELLDNAIRFGAMAQPDARLTVFWRIEGDPAELVIEWSESGVHGDPADTRRGFGFELFDQALPYELQASTSRHFAVDGLRCRIAIPLTEILR